MRRRSYASIAPSAPHAAAHAVAHLHPARVVGRDDRRESACLRGGIAVRIEHNQPVAPERLHALDYMVYAYLQQGRDRAARSTIDTAQKLTTISLANDALIANYNQVAMEARLPLERGDWARRPSYRCAPRS